MELSTGANITDVSEKSRATLRRFGEFHREAGKSWLRIRASGGGIPRGGGGRSGGGCGGRRPVPPGGCGGWGEKLGFVERGNGGATGGGPARAGARGHA